MPPKKKGSRKKPAKARTPTFINGLSKEELSKEELEEHILRLRDELDREREERNYFQLERDRIHGLREVTERTLEETKAQLKKVDKEIEDEEACHRENIKVYRQKMKHLLCEHQNTVCELKADGLVSAEAVQNEQKQLEMKLRKEMRAIVVDMSELQIEIPVNELKMKHDEEMAATKNNWEKHIAELTLQKEEKMQMMQQELDNLRKDMVSEMEDAWNNLIALAKEDHSKLMDNVQSLIKQKEEEKTTQQAMLINIGHQNALLTEQKREHLLLLQDNKRLMEIISKGKGEIAEIEKKIRYYSDKTDTMEKIKAKELKALKCDYEALEQQFSKLQLEKDEICKTFSQRIAKMQQQADAKRLQQENEVQALSRSVEETRAQLNAVLSAPNMDHTGLQAITQKVLETLDAANTNV